MERIDKIVAVSLGVSRNDARSLVKKGCVTVNGETVKSISDRFDEKTAAVVCNGKNLCYSKYVYIMMNKPKGVVSASEGERARNVVDILPDEMKRKNLFPAGRLDKDTTGFVLITDDGDFAHKILSPKNHIPKTYIATLDKPFDENVITAFRQGVQLKDALCQSAQISAVEGDFTKAEVTISQGMYHQIKRMFAKFGITVLELERIKMGALFLDKSLASGECRYMTPEEIEMIKNGI